MGLLTCVILSVGQMLRSDSTDHRMGCVAPAGSNTIHGTVYYDDNANTTLDAGEQLYPGATIRLYDDADSNGIPDAGILTTTTSDANGEYSFDTILVYEQSYTYDQRIQADADDAHEQSNGDVKEFDNDIKIGKSGEVQYAGFRFVGLNIPSGATIDSALLTFDNREDKEKTTSVDIFAEESAAPLTFSDANNISTRTLTSAFTKYDIDWVKKETGDSTADISAMIQEVVNTVGGFSELVFILKNNADSDEEVKIMAHDDKPLQAARLILYYTAPVSAAYHFLTGIDVATLPATSSLTTASYQSAAFYGVDVADCNNDFGFDITSPNADPTAVDDVDSTDATTAIAVDVLDNDTDPESDDLTITISSVPDQGATAVVNDNGTAADPTDDFIDFTPEGSYFGNETFEYVICDDVFPIGCDTAEVTIYIACINDTVTVNASICQGDSFLVGSSYYSTAGAHETVIAKAHCDSVVNLNLTLDTPPSAAVAGPDQTLCNISSFTMAATAPTVGSGLWTIISGSATITTPASPISTVTSVVAGTSVTLRWTVSNGTCPDSTDDITILNEAQPTSAAGLDQDGCNTSQFTMAATPPTIGTGLWSIISGSATITNPTSPTTVVKPVMPNTNVTLRWTVSNGICTDATDDITIQNDSLPIADAGPDQTICNTSSFTMAANNPTIGTGNWSIVSGLATITTPSSPTTTVTAVTAGSTATLRWTVTNGACAPSDDVVIQNDEQPTAAAGPDQTLCNTANFTMAATTPSAGTGAWSIISGIATITTPASPTSTVTGVAIGASVTLRWTVSNGVCADATDDIIIQNDELPSPSVAGPDQTLCNTSSFTMAATAPAVGTGLWSIVSGSATITTPASPTTTVTGVVAGTNVTLRWTISNGVCTDNTDDIIIQSDALPSAAVAGPDQTLCNTANFTMAATAPAVGTGAWSIVSGAATITTPASPTSTVTGVVAGTNVTLRWTVSNGVCTDATDDITIQNDEQPTSAAGPDQTLCNTASFTMAATAPAVGSGVWSIVSGSATITIPASSTSTVTGVVAGTSVTLRWTVSNGVCADATDDITIQNDELPSAAVAGLDQTLCNTANFTMAATAPGVGSGVWSIVSGSATITTPASSTSTVTGVVAGTSVTLRWTVSNGVCADNTDDITIQNDEQPTSAAGPDQTLCNTSSFTMAATAPAVGTGAWSIVSGSATITTAASPTSTVTGVVAGTSVTLRWTVSNGVCADATDDITIQNDEQPTAAAGPDQTLCNTANFTMAATAPSVGTGAWSIVSGSATITTPASPISTVTGVAIGASVTLRWTVSNGVCTDATDDITIQNDEQPTAAAGPAQTLCNTASFTMAATSPAAGTGAWSIVSGSATITTPASPTSTVTGVVAGTSVTLRWTVSNGVCTDATDDITIQSDELPSAAVAGPDQTLCNTSSFTMAATAPAVGTGLWSIVSGLATITAPASPTTTVTGVAAGTSVTLRWTVSNGVCTDNTDDITIQSDALPSAAVAGPDQTLCNTANFTMAATAPAVGTGAWSIVSGAATITTPASPTSTVTGVVAGTNVTLRWTVSNGVCTDATDDITIQNDEQPTSAAGPDQTLCNTASFTMAATAPSVGTGAWSVVSGSATITTPASPTTTVTGVVTGTSVTLRWTVSNGLCADATDDITIQNDELPSTAVAGPDQTLCNSSSFTMAATAPAVGSGLWTIVSGSATITTPASPTSTVTGVVAGTSVTLRWTMSNGVCADNTDDITINSHELGSVAVAGPDQTLCNTSSFTMAATTPTVGSGTWSIISGSATITTPASPTSTVTGVAAGTSVTLRWTVSNGVCISTIDDITINNDESPTTSAAGIDQTICNTTAFTMAANTPAVGTGAWSIVSGSATITTPASPTTTITGVVSETSVTLRWTISNGVCTASTDDIIVTNSNCPPVAVDDADNTTPGTGITIDVLANDSDPEGHAITITSISVAPNQGGTAVINNNGTPGNPADDFIDFTPSGTYIGVETFEYTICDDRTPALCDAATVTVTINADPPVANDDAKTTDENVPALIDVVANDTDADGDLDPATVVITQNPSNGTITNISALGVVTYTPNAGYFGGDSFKYKVSDVPGAQSNEATVTLTVVENLPPVALDDTDNTTEGVAVTIPVFVNDSDPNGDLNVLSASTTGLLQPSHGTVVAVPGTGFQYTPTAGYQGFDQFEYLVCDSSQFTPLCDTALVTVFVSCPGTTGGQENEISGVLYIDQDSSSSYGAGEVGFEGAQIYLYADQDSNNIPDGAALTSTVTDANGGYTFDTLLVYLNSYTYDMRIQADADDAHEQTNGDVKEFDNDIKIGKNGENNLGGFRFINLSIPANAIIDSAYIIIDNGDGNARTTSVDIFGEESASPVTFSDVNKLSTRTLTTAFTKFDIDWAGNANDYSSPDVSNVVQEVVNTVGAISELVFITQNNGDSDDEIKVMPHDNKPLEAARLKLYYSIPGSGPYHFLTEAETNDFPATSILTTPQYQSAAFYTQGTTDCNNDFGFYIVDQNPNIAPVAVDDTETTTADFGVAVDVLANDTDTAVQTIEITSISVAPNHGGTAVINNNGTPLDVTDDFIDFTPSGTYSGPETFEYTICDNGYPSLCDVAIVTITVNPNPAPIAVDDADTTDSQTSIAVDVLANDSDPEGQTITITSISTAPNHGGTAVINNNGTPLDPTDDFIDFTPSGTYDGSETFEYQICDNGAISVCDVAQVTIYIACINDTVTINSTICQGDSVVVGSTSYNTTGIHETIINNPNCDSVVILNLTVDPQPSAALAGPDQTLCNTSSFTMAATAPAVGTGAWTIVSGSATITTVDSPTSTITAVAAGTSVTLRWTVSNGVCADNTDDITIQNDVQPTSAAGPDQTLCNTSTFTMAATAPAVGTGVWSIISGSATITTPTSPTSTVTAVATGTSVTLRWTVSNGVCVDATDDIVIQNDELSSASVAGPDQTLCNTSTFNMAATAPAVGSGAWSIVSGSATITSPASPTSTITAVAVGTSVTLRWTISNGVCSDNTDDITVQNDDTPSAAVAGPDQTLCNTSTFTMAATAPAIGTGLWSIISGSATITTPASPTSTITGAAAGTSVTLRWTVSNGVCSDATDDITIQNDELPTTSAAGADQTICNTSSFTMAANTPVLGTGTWSVVSGSATITTPGSPTTTITAVASETSTTLRWTITNGFCTSTDDIVVTNSNCPPVAVDDADNTTPGTAIAIDVLTNDSDPEGHAITITSISTAPDQGGSAVINNNGTPGNPADDFIDFTPSGTYIGVETFEYTICDGRTPSLCDTAIVTVTINADPPVAIDDSKTTDENVPALIDVVANDTDGDGDLDPATVVITQNPSNGTITNISALGVVTYTPNAGYFGGDSFKYKVSDVPGAQSNEATVTITVIENLPPNAVDDNANTTANTAVVINVFTNDTDPNGDLNIFSASTTGVLQAANGTVVALPGTGYQYTPDTDYEGFDQFEYIVCDSSQFSPLCDTALVTIFVDCDGIASGVDNEVSGTVYYDVDSSGSYNVGEVGYEGAAVYLYLDDDENGVPDGPALQTEITDANGQYAFVVNLAFGVEYSYDQRIQHGDDDAHEEPNGDIKEDDNDVKLGKTGTVRHAGFRFTNLGIPSGAVIDSAYIIVDNGDGNSRNSSVDIFGEVSAAPSQFSDANIISTRTKTTSFVKFDINWAGNENDYSSPDVSSLMQEVVNGVGAIDEFAFIMTNNASTTGDEVKIMAYNDKPLESARLIVYFTEPGDEPYPFLVEVDANSLPFSSVLTTPQYQTATFNVPSTKDCSNNFGFFITDLTPNVAPLAVNDLDTTVADVAIMVDVLANDSDPTGQGLIISAITVAPDQGGSATINDNGTPFIYTDDFIDFVPSGNYAGDEVFTYQLCDNDYSPLCVTATVTIHILPNIPPVAIDDDINTYADLAIVIDVMGNDFDPDLDNLTISAITTAPDYGGSAVINDNGTPLNGADDFIDFTPSGAFVGIETFYYALCDDGVPFNRCDTAQVTITILPNTNPVAVNDYDTTRADIPISVDVLGNDSDLQGHQSITITAISSAPDQGGTAVINNNGTPLDPTDDFIDYTPSGLYEGPESFDYVICDNGLPGSLCDTATVFIELLENPVPFAVDDATSLDQQITIPIYVMANDYDIIARQGIVYMNSIVAAPDQGGTAVINDNATPLDATDDYIDYTPSGLFIGDETFEYIICDDGAPVKCDTALVTVTLLANINPPTVVDDYDTLVSVPTANIIDILSNDSELDGHLFASLTISSSPDQGGSAVINDNGTPFDISDDYVVYTPTGLYVGDETFQYTLCDNGILTMCSTGTVTITLIENEPPVATNDTTRVLENYPKTITVLENDYDSTGFIVLSSVSVITAPTLGTTSVNPLTGEITYTPNPDITGPDQFTYVICDNGAPAPGLCDTAIVDIVIVSYEPDAVIDTFHTGALIIDMDVSPPTYGNSLEPYGLVYELVTTYSIPVSWAIDPDKEFDDIDFSALVNINVNKDYRGGPFIIPFEYRSPVIDAVVDTWRASGVVVDEAVQPFAAPIVDIIDGFGNIVLDDENNGIVEPYFENAGIPSSAYRVGAPTILNQCEDLFVLPHANPTWPHHNALHEFVTENRGYVYAACRAVSILESLRDPVDTTLQLNFLTEMGLQCYNGGDCGSHIGQDHDKDPTLPYLYDSTWAGVELNQRMDDFYDATENGSEQWYIPIDGSQWRDGAVNMLMTSDTNDVGAMGTKMAFGFAFDDADNGMAYYHGGHKATNGSTEARIAAQRGFFNFMFMASRKPGNDFEMEARIPKTCYTPASVHQMSAGITDGGNGPFTYTWTTTLDGTFSSPNDTATSFTLNTVDYGVGGTITVTVEDGCGRKKFKTIAINRVKVDAKITQPECYGERSASIDLSVDGDCGPYTYTWIPYNYHTEDLDSAYGGAAWVEITNAQGYQMLYQYWINPTEDVYCSGALPVELSAFYGENRGDENHLHWTTLSEVNNDFFNVLRSKDGAFFERIGIVDGSGTTTAINNYDFIDEQPFDGINYYRLEQVDFDGTKEYSQIIDLYVERLGSTEMNLWPNPTSGDININLLGDLKGNTMIMKVYDMTGAEIQQQEIDISNQIQFRFDLGNLPHGMYLVELWNNYHQFSEKVIVN